MFGFAFKKDSLEGFLVFFFLVFRTRNAYMCMSFKRFLCFVVRFMNKKYLSVVPVKAVNPVIDCSP